MVAERFYALSFSQEQNYNKNCLRGYISYDIWLPRFSEKYTLCFFNMYMCLKNTSTYLRF